MLSKRELHQYCLDCLHLAWHGGRCEGAPCSEAGHTAESTCTFECHSKIRGWFPLEAKLVEAGTTKEQP